MLRPGDVFVTPVPLSREFLRYAYGLTGVPPESVAVIEVPPAGAVPLARAVREAGLVEQVRALAGDRGATLLPTALDALAIAFARDIGIEVHPYPHGRGRRGRPEDDHAAQHEDRLPRDGRETGHAAADGAW
ncbi:hypothetical protein ACFWBN_05670 [Streptomyces sp. NPDC059989]|uniref:preATP grasp domain-containing protein n=1 Tax=Streptomyces sp. NPDC059989 TaxID=3347026 RepID=UPI003686B186